MSVLAVESPIKEIPVPSAYTPHSDWPCPFDNPDIIKLVEGFGPITGLFKAETLTVGAIVNPASVKTVPFVLLTASL